MDTPFLECLLCILSNGIWRKLKFQWQKENRFYVGNSIDFRFEFQICHFRNEFHSFFFCTLFLLTHFVVASRKQSMNSTDVKIVVVDADEGETKSMRHENFNHLFVEKRNSLNVVLAKELLSSKSASLDPMRVEDDFRRTDRRASSISSLGNWTGAVVVSDVNGTLKKNEMWQTIVDFLDLTLLNDSIYLNIVLGLSFALYSDMAFFTLQPMYLFEIGYSKVIYLLTDFDCFVELKLDWMFAEWNGFHHFRRRSSWFSVETLLGCCQFVHSSQSSKCLLVRRSFNDCLAILLPERSQLSSNADRDLCNGISANVASCAAAIGLCWIFKRWTVCSINRTRSEMIIFRLSLNCFCQFRFPSGYGLFMFLQGNITFIIGPFIGWIRDVTGSYEISFHCLTFAMALCAIPWIIEIIFNEFHRKYKTVITK